MKKRNNSVGKSVRQFVAVLSLTGLFSTSGITATFYVSKAGNDANAGTQSQPWLTIQKAANVMVAGDTVLVRTGTYAMVRVTKSGQSGKPITYQVYPGDSVTVTGGSNNPDGFSVSYASYIVIDGFIIKNCPYQGVYLRRSNYVTIRNCTVSYTGREAISFRYSNHGLVEKNKIYSTGTTKTNGEGIYLGTESSARESGEVDKCDGTILRGNEIYNTWSEPIDVKPGAINLIIESNICHDSQIADGGGINLEQDDISTYPNHIIRNNIVHHITTRTAWQDGNGIRVANGAMVYNNLCYSNQHNGIRTDDKKRYGNLTKVYHNTLYNNGAAAVGTFDGVRADIRNNIGPTGSGNIAASSNLFVNVTNSNFDLKVGTAATDSGVSLGISTDIKLRSRPYNLKPDMGAYEYSGTSSSISETDSGPLLLSEMIAGSQTAGPAVTSSTTSVFIPFAKTSSLFQTRLVINNLSTLVSRVKVSWINQNREIGESQALQVSPLGFQQIADINRMLAVGDSTRSVEGVVRVESDQPIHAWLSKLDRSNHDPSLLPGRQSGSPRILIPSAANLLAFRSSLLLTNVSSRATQVSLRAYNTDGLLSGKTQTPLSVLPHGTLDLKNVLEILGAKDTFGPLEIVSLNDAPLLASSWIVDANGSGGFLEGHGFEEASRSQIIPFVIDNSEQRSNLGLNNVTESVANVTVRFRTAQGHELGLLQTTVPPHGLTQLNHVASQMVRGSHVSNLEGSLELESNQPIFAWVSQIDNMSQDPGFVNGQRQGFSRLLIPGATNSGEFRSTLVIFNQSSTVALVDVICRSNEGEVVGHLEGLSIPAQGYFSSSDIMADLGLSEHFGQLEIISRNGESLMAISRVYSTSRTSGILEGRRFE